MSNGWLKEILKDHPWVGGIIAVVLVMFYLTADRYPGKKAVEVNEGFEKQIGELKSEIETLKITLAQVGERVKIAKLQGQLDVLKTIIDATKVPPPLFKEKVDRLERDVDKLREQTNRRE